ncbi:MAG: chemotaxis protein CheW, partial [Bryobacteraceae bacterium]
MSSASSYLLQHLRRQFDSSFELAPPSLADYDDVLFIRVAEQRFALLVREIKGLAKIEELTPVPSSAEGFAGLTAARGEVMPVFDLSALLGMGPSPGKLAWMVRVDAPECAVGLAFSEVEGYSRTPQSEESSSDKDALLARTLEFRGQTV